MATAFLAIDHSAVPDLKEIYRMPCDLGNSQQALGFLNRFGRTEELKSESKSGPPF